MADTATSTAASTAPPRRPSLLATAGSWVGDLPGLIGDRVELLALELRRAGMTLTQLLALGAVALLLGLTAWFALWVLVAGGLYALGMHWAFALLIVLAINLAGAVWSLMHMRRIAPLLGLPATRRHLSFKSTPAPGAAASSPSSPAAQPHGPDLHAAPDPAAADAARRAA
jgi:uncharacterized membrane protein YqjE